MIFFFEFAKQGWQTKQRPISQRMFSALKRSRKVSELDFMEFHALDVMTWSGRRDHLTKGPSSKVLAVLAVLTPVSFIQINMSVCQGKWNARREDSTICYSTGENNGKRHDKHKGRPQQSFICHNAEIGPNFWATRLKEVGPF